jgi:diguanylate cyclase (GGDEF)-like protein
MPGHPAGESASNDPRPGAIRYGRATSGLVAAVVLLAGVAAFLLADQRKRIWDAAHQNALNIALGLESAATSVLKQPSFSLQGIRADLTHEEGPPPEKTISALRDAMRFDPVSEYLGISTTRGGITVVDHAGNPVPLQLSAQLRVAISRTEGPEVVLSQLFQLPGRGIWYLPVTLEIPHGGAEIPHGGGERDVAFALVPARSLVAGTESLRLVPHSWVSLITTDGTRLLGYSMDSNVLDVNGPRMPPELLKRAVGKTGVGELLEPITHSKSVVGYSRSETLPLFVGTVVPVSSLYTLWLKEAVGPVAVLAAALVAVAIFWMHLRASLRRQQRYIVEQEHLATHDTLTGLLNRDAFVRLLEQVVSRRGREPFALLLIDLNRFKDINDSLGHAAGDSVLELLGKRLNTLLKTEDALIARLGGDELAILLGCASLRESLASFCERVQACMGETIRLSGVELHLTGSIGVTLYPEDASTPSELLRCADIAMYAAKNELRSYSRYSKEMDNCTAEMLALRSEFAKALREGGLSIAYQPKIRLSSGALAGLEALSRWVHPRVGPLLPSKYVQLAETTELIHPFTLFMLERTVQQVARWRAAGHTVPVSVNISANNLLDHDFVKKLAGVLESAAVPGTLLELEVTESAVMRHPDVMLKRLEAVRDLGVRLSIDDFGTGYASLSYLKRLPVQSLKIDKAFVLNLDDDEADQRIVRGSIRLAHGFGMTVVAEGVESASAAERLKDYGCDYGQGFYFGRPAAAAEIEARWLRFRAAPGARGEAGVVQAYRYPPP